MSRILLATGVAAIVVLVTSSCSSPPAETPRNAPAVAAVSQIPTTSVTPKPHWVQDARLRAVMGQLAMRSPQSTAWPKDMPQDPEEPTTRSTEWYFGQVYLLAADLAGTAQLVPAAVDSSKLSEADRAGFQAEAAMLGDQALRLRDAANAHKIEQMQRLLDQIDATCISCHSRYRDFSGQIDLRDAKFRGV